MALDDLGFNRRTFLIGAATGTALLSSGILSSCSDDDSASSLVDIDVQLSWLKTVSFAGSYIADDRGYFRSNGLNVTLTAGGPNVVVPPLIAADKGLVGMASTDVTASTRAAGSDLVIVGARFQKSPFTIISLQDRPITAPEELVGLRVGVSPTNELAFRSFLTLNGIDSGDVTQLPIQFDAQPLLDNQVDAILGYYTAQPNAMRASGIEPVTMLLADFGFELFENVYITRRSNLDRRREQIVGFLRAEQKGWDDAVKDPSLAVKVTLDKYGAESGLDPASQELEAKSQAELIVSADTDANGLFWMSPSAIESNLQTLSAIGIEATDELFDTSLLEEIRG